ncbi:MAG: PilZ domain-containing protein [Sphingobium sp.]
MTLNDSARREDRHALRADIRVTGPDAHAEAVMVDISRHGLGTDGLMHFAPDSAVRVDFPDGSSRLGQAMWRDGFWSGIRFDTPIDPAELEALFTALTLTPHFPRKQG